MLTPTTADSVKSAYRGASARPNSQSALTAAIGRKRTVENRPLLKSNVRFTPGNGRSAGTMVNGRLRPKADNCVYHVDGANWTVVLTGVLPSLLPQGSKVNQGVELTPAVKKVQIALTVIGLSGIILSFVPFTPVVAPIGVILNALIYGLDLWLLVAPCVFLPILVSMGYVLWLITGRLHRWTMLASYVFAALFMCSSLAGFIYSYIDDSFDPNVLALNVLFALSFTIVGWLSIRGIKQHSTAGGLVAMQGVYAIQMTYWVMAALDDFQIGAWLAVISLPAYLAQIALALKRPWWVMAVAVSMAGIALLIPMGFW